MSTEIISIPERKARIFNVQKYSIYDGPGIRTLIFFKGCPLRCKWCSNPEGLERKYQVMYRTDLCTHCGSCVAVCPVGVHHEANCEGMPNNSPSQRCEHRVDRGRECIGCRRCESICPKQALSIAGEDKAISEVLDIIQQDAPFYRSSGGGVTLGGGEVSSQPDFAANLLMECQRLGIHTAIETCGYAQAEQLLKIAQFSDLILYDLKHIDSDQHYELTGVRNERILDNLTELFRRGHSIKIRMPLIKGFNDHQEILRRTMEFLEPFRHYKAFQGIDLLPYHKLGINKYKQLDLNYMLADGLGYEADELNGITDFVQKYALQAQLIRH